jgi:hypothetical protein
MRKKRIFNLAGACFSALALYFAVATWLRLTDDNIAEAEVVEIDVIEPSATGNPDSNADKIGYVTIVRYVSDDGRQVEARSRFIAAQVPYKIGTRVKVYYDPAEPHQVRFDSFADTWGAPVLFGFGALVCFFLAVRSRTKPARAKPTRSR